MTDDIKKLLDYQKVDAGLKKLEKEIAANPNKINAQKMLEVFKKEQQNAENLEKEAGKVIEEFNKVKGIYETNVSLAGKLSQVDVEKLTDEKIEKLNEDLENVLNNLGTIEKKLVLLNKNVEEILKKFDVAKKQAANAKAVYVKSKDAYEAFIKEKTSNYTELKNKLTSMQKELNPTLFKRYQAVRQDKIFPVLVPLNESNCGYCQMSLNANDANQLKTNGFIICENCHRIIYV